MNKYIVYSLIFLAGIILGFGIFKGYDTYKDRNNKESQEENYRDENIYSLSKDISASIVWWDQDNGFESVKNNKDKISALSPVWYEVKKDGSLKKFTGAENQEIINFAKSNNIKIVPTIGNDCIPDNLESVLGNDELMVKHISNVLDLVDNKGYDGIDIDYECLSGKEGIRDKYSNFMTALSGQLHERHKLLTTSVHAKSTDEGTWEGPASQDWRVLGKVCDQVKLMTYDYHWATSEAGDIAPTSWMEETLAYAVKNIDPNKIYLGIHFYGYDWVGEEAQDLTYNDVQELIEKHKPSIHISGGEEKYFTYNEGENTHAVYFADNETVLNRLALVGKYNIAGIGIWRLGQEDSKNWDSIGKILK